MKTILDMNMSAVGLAPAPIVCGTDLSLRDDIALNVATTLARRVSAPVVLAHAIELPRAVLRDARISSWIIARRNRSVSRAAERLRKTGVGVEGRVRVGRPSVVVAEMAAALRARLTVVHSAGPRRWESWLGESVSVDTTARATTPTLVLRGAEPMAAWLRDERPLRVFVCFDGTVPCEGALRWVKHLAAAGAIEVVVGNVGGRDVEERVRGVWGDHPVRRRSAPRGFRVVARLLGMASEERADLMVVGSERRRGWKGWLRRSVSAGVVARSGVSVVVVPECWSAELPVPGRNADVAEFEPATIPAPEKEFAEQLAA